MARQLKSDGRRELGTSTTGQFADFFCDDVPDPFNDPKVRERIAQTIARAALKAHSKDGWPPY